MVGVLVLLTLVAVFSRRPSPAPTTDPTSTNSTVDRWPLVYDQNLAVSLPLPSGMNLCQLADRQQTVRLAACGEAATDAVTVRGQTDWNTLEVAAAFDQAFAQELREAGLPGLGVRGTSLEGSLTSVRFLRLSETVTAAIVRDKQVREQGSRTISVLFRRDAPFQDSGVDVPVDSIVEPYLRAMTFFADPKAAVPPSRLKTFVSPSGWRFEYPTASSDYQASPLADFSVSYGAGARLEVRSGTSVDAVRGSTSGYRKLNDKPLDINGSTLNEERFVPDGGTSTRRLLFVSLTNDGQVVGFTLRTTGQESEEETFEAILKSFSWS
ncbi:MAG: hypothetical protein HY421_00835 [Candidatus Kerfeldbacteria bacterium]|nr:hypothetical protein [Candidatus Kerfeldbacteria bacterium]